MLNFEQLVLQKIDTIKKQEAERQKTRQERATELANLAKDKLLSLITYESIFAGKVKTSIDYGLKNISDIDTHYLDRICNEDYIHILAGNPTKYGRIYEFRLNLEALLDNADLNETGFIANVFNKVKEITEIEQVKREKMRINANAVLSMLEDRLVDGLTAFEVEDGSFLVKVEVPYDMNDNNIDLLYLQKTGDEHFIKISWRETSPTSITVSGRLDLKRLMNKQQEQSIETTPKLELK